jgi:oligopeptide transport system permease protein
MNPFALLFRSLASILLVAWAAATLTFILMKLVPGGPLSKERQIPVAVQRAIEARYRLDQPWPRQYVQYLADAARLEFGPSYDDPGRTVGEIIAQRLPRSMALGAVALCFALAFAFPMAIFASLRRGGWPDRALGLSSAAGVSVPSFVLGALLLYLFAFRLRLFPAGGWGGPAYLVLPAVALAAMPAAYLSRLIRSGLLEVMRSEFILAARARGLSRPRAVVVHALRHTLSPVLAWLGPQAAAVMTGSFVVERIFSIPGLGQLYVTSIGNRNYPMIMGVTLVYCVLLVSLNLIGDALSRLFDPRLSEDRR